MNEKNSKVIEIQFLDKCIADSLQEERRRNDDNHVSSGKLVASVLGQPLQWQVLHAIGVRKEFDEYTLRKFERGKQVEDWIVSRMPGRQVQPLKNGSETQKWVDYKGAGGYVDSIVDMGQWNLGDLGVLPNEVKSVTNMKYKHIVREGKPDEAHALQSSFYALGLGKEKAMVTYVASDDFRIVTYLIDVNDHKEAIDKNIEDFNKLRSEHRVPAFEPTFSWTAKDDYNSYLEFKDMNEEEIISKLRNEYPRAYEKL